MVNKKLRKKKWILDVQCFILLYVRPNKIDSLLSVTRAHWLKGRAFSLFTTKSPHLGILFALSPFLSHNAPISSKKTISKSKVGFLGVLNWCNFQFLFKVLTIFDIFQILILIWPIFVCFRWKILQIKGRAFVFLDTLKLKDKKVLLSIFLAL